jgi:hypothetical protein
MVTKYTCRHSLLQLNYSTNKVCQKTLWSNISETMCYHWFNISETRFTIGLTLVKHGLPLV